MRNETTKEKKKGVREINEREGQATLEPSQNPQKSKVVQHLTAAFICKKKFFGRPSLEASDPMQEAPELKGKNDTYHIPLMIDGKIRDPCRGL